MFYSDHAPPHIHAMYNDYGAVVALQTGEVLDGKLPPRALRMVREWMTEHASDLMADWELARQREPLVAVPPLE